jgi:N-glycosylase/DNA lyase
LVNGYLFDLPIPKDSRGVRQATHVGIGKPSHKKAVVKTTAQSSNKKLPSVSLNLVIWFSN